MFNLHAQTDAGAILFAVCRGKVSEGLDFGDANARAVFVVGLPFPNIRDMKVTLKMEYNNQIRKTDKTFLSGDEWYSLQAFRAVNQGIPFCQLTDPISALGRCIRHKDDYGAVMLVDSRYSLKDKTSKLSKWVRSQVRTYPSFENSLQEMRKFFQNTATLYK